MRLAAQLRGGFFPAPPAAIAHASTFLRPPGREPFAILDPSAGQGAAIRQLGELLGCAPANIYAIELDDSRAEQLRANLPDAHVLAPASFFGCRASYGSFPVIFLNPPFDDSYGGYRVEDQFLRTATDWLMPGGVMALVCPEAVVGEFTDARRHFAAFYDNCTIVPFPKEHRRFTEVIVFGQKRFRPRSEKSDAYPSWEAAQGPDGFVYTIPAGPGPRLFQKVEPTEPELQRILAGSPLRTHLSTPLAPAVPAPPLPLGVGHVALLLASGHLDGVVQPDGRPPHVVRGTARKREFISDVTESDNEDGTTTTKTTISEKIELVVRTVDLTGHIRTFMDAEEQEEAS